MPSQRSTIRIKPGSDREPEFNARDERLALCLAKGLTRQAAADECGMGLRTVFTRLESESFRRLVAEYRVRMLDEAVGQLAAAGSEAITELKSLIKDNSPNIRLRACCEVLDNLIAIGTFADLSERIAKLEAIAADAQSED